MSFLSKYIQRNTFIVPKTINIFLNPSRSIGRSAKFARLKRNLGFPERPKAPLVPFVRFMVDVHPTLDNIENRKVLTEIGALWKVAAASKKAIYRQEYERDMTIYRDKMREYKSQISEEQFAQLKQQKQQLIKNKILARENKEQKIRDNLLGKPKRPATFMLFSNELRQNSPKKMSSSDISARWKALSESERKTYSDRCKELLEQFKKDSEEWLAKMRKVGHVVRDSKARSATRKIDSEENSEAAKDNCETELEKPKRPLQSFFVFTHEMRESSSKKLRLSEIAAKYNALSVDERSIYTNKAKENTERYRHELLKWKRKTEKNN